MLTQRTYTALFLSASIAFPAAALASGGTDAPAPKIALAAAKPVKMTPFSRPIERFHEAIRIEVRKLRAERRARRKQAFATLPGGVSQSTLDAIAACESGGNPTAVSAGGTYRGLYQFDYGTWASVGGSGDPAAASASEQSYRAALLYSRAGSSPWPICG